MAIFHFTTKIISRSAGKSAVACAAYRTGDKLYDERYDRLQDYTKKQDVIYSEIILPDQAPAWMKDRGKLWNHIEKIEARKDSRLAREFEIALPRELTYEQNIALIKEFAHQEFISKGFVVDVAIHDGIASDGKEQPHAHLMLIERELAKDGFGKKYRGFNEYEKLLTLRMNFCNVENKHLALNGHDIRVDHRSLKEQGIDLLPQKKIGPTGSFQQMAAYAQHVESARTNGERLLVNPEIVLDVLANQQSTFTRQDIARIVNRYTADGEQFLAVYEKVKALPSLVYLGLDNKSHERFTTQGMIQLESEMMDNARSLYGRDGHAVKEGITFALADKHQLSKEQAAVLDYVVSMGDLKNVIGFAGTGKSRLLGAAREVWEASGYRVLGATLSGIAAENLEGSSGIPSRTLASRLLAWDQERELLTSKDILVIDEAGMIGTRQMAEIMEEANKHSAKVVLVGDPEQLQAIEAGAAFRGVIEKHGYVELTEIWRQEVAWQREATVQFATQKTADAIAQYAAHDCVHVFETKAEAMRALVSGWNDIRISQPDKSQIILAYTRDEVLELNQIARAFCRETGDLKNESFVMTDRGERLFAEGERVYFLKNDRDLGVKNGTLGIILKIDNNLLTIKLDKDEKDKAHTICFSPSRYNHLDYGYATTVYKSQSVTIDRSSILASRYMDSHSAYVEMTRHKEGAEIYWSKDEFNDYADMVKVFSRERNKDLVQDYLSQEFDKASFAKYRGFDTLWDVFWEKYGKEWLEKMQGKLSIWVDNAKEFVEIVKEQVSQKLGKNEVHKEGNYVNTIDDAWLDKMRSIRDEAYKNNPELVKELRERRGSNSIVQEATTNKNAISISPSSFDKPITAEQRTYYEERYHEIMKDTEMKQNRIEVDHSTAQSEKSDQALSEMKIKKIDKDMEIDF